MAILTFYSRDKLFVCVGSRSHEIVAKTTSKIVIIIRLPPDIGNLTTALLK